MKDVLAGWLLMTLLALSLANAFVDAVAPEWAGLAGWGAGVLLARRLRGAARIQVTAMLTVGVAGLVGGTMLGVPVRLGSAISANQVLLAMLVGVSFLRLVALPAAERREALPQGRRALWRTLLGVHFFGAVINLSALMILGERLSTRAPLTRLQATVLSRGFGAAANWSPFFAAMGVALTNAPGAGLKTLVLIGLPVALIALTLTGVALMRDPEASRFQGYPMHFEALLLPGVLTVSVLVLHEAWPQVRILSWIALLSPLIAGGGLIMRDRRRARYWLTAHVRHGLPQMASELLLFLAAGVLAAGIANVAEGLGLSALITRFGPLEATGLVAVMVLVAVAGVHPVISISVAGGLLMPAVTDPNLLAMVFLMSWSLGVTASPLSGMHLAMQGRFGVAGIRFTKWNIRYVVVMWVVDGIALHVYTWLTGGGG